LKLKSNDVIRKRGRPFGSRNISGRRRGRGGAGSRGGRGRSRGGRRGRSNTLRINNDTTIMNKRMEKQY
jgi:hypothetical protein